MKLKKRKKSSRYKGRGMGTAGTGARKNKRKSGNKGGTGLAGTGKRADHKKTLILKLYGHDYFGKQGITSKKTKRDTRQRINVGEVSLNIEKFGIKKGDTYEVNLLHYKLLGTGDVKVKMNVTCLDISASAKEKIEKAGGSVTLKEKKKIETPIVKNPKHEKKKEKGN